MEKLSRWNELSHRAHTEEEESEFQKLSRIDALAKDFAKSHRYMLDKDEYSQQDMDYAFALEKKEKDTHLNLNEKFSATGTSSSVYQSLFLETVFKGMKERASAFIAKNNINRSTDADILKSWLDDDMSKCILNKRKEMTGIITAMSKTEEEYDRQELVEKMLDLIRDRWIRVIFKEKIRDKNIDIVETYDRQNDGNDKTRGDLLRYAYEQISAGGKMRDQVDACVIRSLTNQQRLFG